MDNAIRDALIAALPGWTIRTIPGGRPWFDITDNGPITATFRDLGSTCVGSIYADRTLIHQGQDQSATVVIADLKLRIDHAQIKRALADAPTPPVPTNKAQKVYDKLRAKPELLREVLQAALADHNARVAGPWVRHRSGHSYHRGHCALAVLIATMTKHTTGWRWNAASAGIADGIDVGMTFLEAQEACDKALRAAGWVLL